jgi:hypothetical protein
MVKCWSIKKSKVAVEELKADLKILFEIANADLTQAKKQVLQLKERILSHFCQHSALHPDNLNWRPAEGKNDEVVQVMQEHLCSRLRLLVERKMMYCDDVPLWPLSGSRGLRMNPFTRKSFHEHFELPKEEPGNEILAWKNIVDLMLSEIIRGLEIIPSRFGQCPRCKCYFCSPTDKERIYCSTKCGNAVRQEKYLEKRRGKDDE